ncbi:PREDICTED: putative cysteine-rich receptor-like protein kinase 12 [Ipomoea nil]|uniref:putative cysteine-rich receptor-like protein kinase 12 n=1 Tax=Ipomoea nil TaxID=35883 RepID=UPI00090197D9|nr:PREDICTED: putative cysteine-rich receptor-like protein kinase 12 [Ipomoea nil]XP_019160377.1 PREDICTED: putative cysteine-rich receptor-like protein kinase 12 [Ipomoea nil]XP_019160378.1 PREDICTED: putative cysteine-rich receptor-like protein kinase 12 [Ipomoea nil]
MDSLKRKFLWKPKGYEALEESSSSVEISPVESLLEYKLITIQNATKNFSEANRLGGGILGPVYKGKLKNGIQVAVKRLKKYEGRAQEFQNAVTLIASVQHNNFVRLLGYCCQEGGESILVYEFCPNGNLENFLFDPVKRGYLDWGRRYKIIERIGKGLVFLHEDTRLHRNLNARNILLDEDLNPKIKNFHMARFALDKDYIGYEFGSKTVRYEAPEYVLRCELSVKSDVYSLGVLILEIISGQRFDRPLASSEDHFAYLSCYVWIEWSKGSSLNVIDPMLTGISSPLDDIIKCIQVALLCVQGNAKDRPTMGEVVQMLSNLSSVSLPIPSAPLHLSIERRIPVSKMKNL